MAESLATSRSARAQSQPARARGASLARLLAAAVLTVCAGLLASELYLRSAFEPPIDPAAHAFVRPPLVRLRVTISRDMPGLSRRSTLFSTNALGVRGEELDLSERGAFRVLTLGDSITECLLLEDHEAWPRRLQDELGRRADRPVWVGNAGRSGELASDYIAHMRVLVPRFAPDLVLVTPGAYELQAAIEEKLFPLALDEPAKLSAYAAKLYAGQNAQAQVNLGELAAFHLGYLLRTRMWPEELDMTPFYTRMRARRAASGKLRSLDWLEDALDVYESNLLAVIAAWRSLPERPRLVFLTPPFLWKPEMSAEEEQTLWGGYTCMDCEQPRYYAHEVLAEGQNAFNRRLLQICEREGIPCFDLEPRIEKNLLNFQDDAHMRAPGAALTARAVADFLFSRRLLE